MMTSSHIPSIILHRLYKHFSADYAAECEKNSLIFHPQWMAKSLQSPLGMFFNLHHHHQRHYLLSLGWRKFLLLFYHAPSMNDL